ncbi:MAG TPA: proline dehydrogenase family protein [Gemmatimonadaceae bacterium]|jgi:proline dehydrogenase|nr:proline dehydrogenase family protein [Gemmatimonadaceae bacterium]
MSVSRSILLAASRNKTLNDFALHSSFVKRATRRFMPGEHAEDALAAAANIAATGRGIIFTQLGEAITRAEAAEKVRDHYLWLFDRIAEQRLPAHVSVKPTQLGLDLSIDQCERQLLELAAKAEQTRSTLWLDMEDSAYVDRTLDLYRAIHERYPATGVAIQAYLRRTPNDLSTLMPSRPMIRLVKGAYDEPARIAFEKKSDTDKAYFDIASGMLEAASTGACTPIFGTHDLGLVSRIAERAKILGLGKNKYEIHMLYGIRDAAQRTLVREGHTVKTLISYGSAWYRWYMRRLAERPANVLFVVRSLIA